MYIYYNILQIVGFIVLKLRNNVTLEGNRSERFYTNFVHRFWITNGSSSIKNKGTKKFLQVILGTGANSENLFVYNMLANTGIRFFIKKTLI